LVEAVTGEHRHKLPNLSARYPLAWVDPEILCGECGNRPAEYSSANGSGLFCGECSQGMDDLGPDDV
jgi:hypothetical protein